MSTLEQESNASVTTSSIRFHLSLNSADLEKSIEFFRAFFGCEPAKRRDDYAKFELADPPLVLSLEPYAAPIGGNLNHLGFRMPSSAALVEVQRRLELAGISTQREEGVECCYARQTKFWVHDPDGNMWEIYTLDDDIEHRGDGRIPLLNLETNDAAGPAPAIWAHRLGVPFTARLPILDQTVDQAVLEGTFNQTLTLDERRRRVLELRRILKPGGVVRMHMLTSSGPTGDAPIRLPGPAAAVEAIPEPEEVLQLFRDAGFVAAKVVFLAHSACFRAAGCEFRETRLEAVAPAHP